LTIAPRLTPKETSNSTKSNLITFALLYTFIVFYAVFKEQPIHSDQ